jgi:hypothetical protein
MVYPEVFRGLEAAIVRISAVGPEIVRGGVLRKFVENKAILRFFAVCEDARLPFPALARDIGLFYPRPNTLMRLDILRFFAVM